MLDHCRKIYRDNVIGGELRHAGSREAGQGTVTEELEEAQRDA
jgi:hypothetical protein